MMLYLANPSSPRIREVMRQGRLACITTPKQGNAVPQGAWYACDNGKFGKGWPGALAWFEWLMWTVDTYGPTRCLFAVAPDVVANAGATLRESSPWLPQIRSLGVPAAFVAQDGSEHGLIPWGEFDVLFIGGSTDWKLSDATKDLAQEAKRRGLKVHMGRVNSYKRLKIADSWGCETADGTYLAFGPDVNLPKLLSWLYMVNEYGKAGL